MIRAEPAFTAGLQEWLARSAYTLLLRLATPLYFARLWWRGRPDRREPAYRRWWPERLGFSGVDVDVGVGRLWLHAVSLGETRAAAPLIDALRAQRPGLRLLLTHGTATGREAGAALLREGDAQAWLPYDTPGAVRRFLRHHRPCAGVLMETEVWPNLLFEAQAGRALVLGVPMVLANARLSERSRLKGQRLSALLHPAVARLTQVLAQTEDDAARLRSLNADHVQVLGNLKFDITPPPEMLARGRAWRAVLARPVVLAAVTRDGEEALLLDAWCALPAPRPLLCVVPRHPQRFDEVAARVAQAGLTLARRSDWAAGAPAGASVEVSVEASAEAAAGAAAGAAARAPAVAADADVWLGDSMGEMPAYYAAADVALLGGSFAPLGGQNLIEAAACGCPIVMGPHTFNFAQAAEQALAAGAALREPDMAAAVWRAVALARGAQRSAISANALAFANAHRGAAERTAASVLRLLPD